MASDFGLSSVPRQSHLALGFEAGCKNSRPQSFLASAGPLDLWIDLLAARAGELVKHFLCGIPGWSWARVVSKCESRRGRKGEAKHMGVAEGGQSLGSRELQVEWLGAKHKTM